MGTFTSSSDVWSFGVTVWEIFNLCQSAPFANHSDDEIIRNFYKYFNEKEDAKDRLNLEKPRMLDEATFKILQKCWLRDKLDRPSFRDLSCVFKV